MTRSTLDDLLAKDEIVDTINRLFIGTDRRDWTMVLDLKYQDGNLELGQAE